MLTLHKATEDIKIIFKWGAIFIIGLLTLIILYRIGINVKEHFYPTPPPPPTVSFGKLPEINFPFSSSLEFASYSIDTLTGTLPQFPDRINVYKIAQKEPTLLAFQKANEKVLTIGLRNPAKITGNLYQWKEDVKPFRNLILDTQSFSFTLSSNFTSDPDILSAKNLPGEKDAIAAAQNFLSSLSSLPNDIDQSKTKTTLFSIENSNTQPASSFSKAQIVKVDFFQKDVNKTPIYYPNPHSSTMNVSVAGGSRQPQIIESHFSHQEINTEISSTYPIKGANEAWDELKEGKAYIVSKNNLREQVSIKNISLGYYLGLKEQQYLMPIIVFEGNNDFYAYVSALKDSWISK